MSDVTISRSTDAATISPDLVMPYTDAASESQNVIHTIIGSPVPDVTLRPALTAAGTLRMFFLTDAAAQTAYRFHLPAAVFTLSAPSMPWLPTRYVTAGKIQPVQQEPARKRWVLEVGFQDVTA